MIARALLDELQQLSREEKLEVIRLLHVEVEDESSELENLTSAPSRVYRIPSVRVNFNEAKFITDPRKEQAAEND